MRNTLPVAYSSLPKVLAKRRLKISDLHAKLKAVGVNVNHKSLYRLTTADPLQKIDTRIIGAICQTCDVNIQDVIAFQKPKPVLEKLSNAEQKRLDELMTQHSEGKLSGEKLRALDELSEKAHQLTMANARILVAQRRALNSTPRPGNPGRSRQAARKRVPAINRVAQPH